MIERSLSMTTSSRSQPTKITKKFSEATTSYYPFSGPHHIEKSQISPIADSPKSPKASNRGQKNIPCLYDLLDTPPATKTFSLPNINSVLQELQGLALHTHSETNKRETGCIVCGKLYEHFIEQTVAHYFHHTAELVETFKDRNIKR